MLGACGRRAIELLGEGGAGVIREKHPSTSRKNPGRIRKMKENRQNVLAIVMISKYGSGNALAIQYSIAMCFEP